MQFQHNGLSVEVMQGDITTMRTTAITNAANSHLILGAGVAGAIAMAGGPTIQEECYAIGHCPVGQAVITGGGDLPARFVIHAVGPQMGEGDEHRKLASAIRSTLEMAEDNQIDSVALPAISTGVFGFPMIDCARIMAAQIRAFAERPRHHLQKVVVCLYDESAFRIFVHAFQAQWADEPDDI